MAIKKTGLTTARIGKMTAEEIQNSIELYAKRLNYRIDSIQKYANENGIDISYLQIALQRELGAQKASRAKIADIEEGRFRLRRIVSVLDKKAFSRLTRTGMKVFWKRKQKEYSNLLGAQLTVNQTIAFNQLTQGMEEGAFDSDVWALIECDPVTNAFAGDVDEFLNWLREAQQSPARLVAQYMEVYNNVVL